MNLKLPILFYTSRHLKKANRPHLATDLWIEDIDSFDIDSAIRPLLDMLWQTFGYERCPYFDDVTGKFAPRQR